METVYCLLVAQRNRNLSSNSAKHCIVYITHYSNYFDFYVHIRTIDLHGFDFGWLDSSPRKETS